MSVIFFEAFRNANFTLQLGAGVGFRCFKQQTSLVEVGPIFGSRFYPN